MLGMDDSLFNWECSHTTRPSVSGADNKKIVKQKPKDSDQSASLTVGRRHQYPPRNRTSSNKLIVLDICCIRLIATKDHKCRRRARETTCLASPDLDNERLTPPSHTLLNPVTPAKLLINLNEESKVY